MIDIASRSNVLNDFLKRFSTEINNPELKNAIIEYIEDLAEGLENANDNTDAFIELIDRASFPIATTAVLSGVTLLVSVGVTLGPLAILCGGTLGLAISGTGRTYLRLRVNNNRADIKKLRKFAVKLKSLP